MAVIVRMGAPMAVGAAFGGKGGLDLAHCGAETAQEVGNHMVRLDQQAIIGDLVGGVTVADMPGDAGQIGGCDFQKRFVRRLQDDFAAIFQDQNTP